MWHLLFCEIYSILRLVKTLILIYIFQLLKNPKWNGRSVWPVGKCSGNVSWWRLGGVVCIYLFQSVGMGQKPEELQRVRFASSLDLHLSLLNPPPKPNIQPTRFLLCSVYVCMVSWFLGFLFQDCALWLWATSTQYSKWIKHIVYIIVLLSLVFLNRINGKSNTPNFRLFWLAIN